jgi:hypothetical protein
VSTGRPLGDPDFVQSIRELIPSDLGSLALNEIQALQRRVDQEIWKGPQEGALKRRHLLFHLIALIGKLARGEEQRDHGAQRPEQERLEADAIADLLVFAIQLAEVNGQPLATLYRQRLIANVNRFATSD